VAIDDLRNEIDGVNASGKRDRTVAVTGNQEIAPGFFRMRLALPSANRVFSPGQFFQLAVGTGTTAPFLRRPFAPAELSPESFAFVYAVVGEGTRLMSRLRPGDRVGLLAPLGKGYARPVSGSRVVLAGGGGGGPSLGPLAAALRENGTEVISILGARTAGRLVGGDSLEPGSHRLVSCTDDGSAGFAGTAADALAAEIAGGRVDAVFACGPAPMLKAVARITAAKNIPCQVSMEERMACGFGACVGCVVEMLLPDGKGTKYGRVCHDGPVFDAGTIVW
jgi:dihydroorotate dehydrogenase electron transfer subunit